MAAKQQRTTLQALGLITAPNEVALPDGALTQADNCVIAQEGKVERRRGIPTFNDDLDTGTEAYAEWADGTVIVKDTDGGLYRNGGSGSWTKYSGDYDRPSGALASRFTRPGSLFFTSDEGVMKLDELTGTPALAGMPEPVITNIKANASGTFLDSGESVRYRVVFGRRDARNRLVLGPPSPGSIVRNTFGANARVDLTVWLGGVRAGDFVQVYRSTAVASGLTPDDELGQVYEKVLTAADISAGTLNIEDNTPDVIRGTALYTNATQEGVAQENSRPPIARDVSTFNGMTFYGDTQLEHTASVQLVDVSTESGLAAFRGTATITSGSNVVTNIASLQRNATSGLDANDLRVGMYFYAEDSGSNELIPKTARIVSIDSATQVTLDTNASGSSSGETILAGDYLVLAGQTYYLGEANWSPSEDPFASDGGTLSQGLSTTAKNIEIAVNENAASPIYAFALSGDNDTPGALMFRSRTLDGPQFTLQCPSRPEAFIPPLSPTELVTSDNDRRQNRVYISKIQQPEAVPRGNFIDVGDESQPMRLVPTQFALFALKPDGVYVIRGTTPDTLRVDPLDLEFKLRENRFDTVAALNDAVYCWSTRGVCRITTRGVEIISRAIDPEIAESSQETGAYAVAHEADQQYILSLGGHSTDAEERIYVLNVQTGTWTRWRMPSGEYVGAMHVDSADRFHVGTSAGKTRRQLRSFAAPTTNYHDDSESVTITGAAGATITLSGAPSLSGSGLWLVQGTEKQRLTTAVGATFQVADADAFSTGAATLYREIPVTLTYAPVNQGKPGMLKRFHEVAAFQDAQVTTYELGFKSDWSGAAWQTVAVTPIDNQDRTFLRCLTPQEACAGNWLQFRLTFAEPLVEWHHNGWALTYRPMSGRFPA